MNTQNGQDKEPQFTIEDSDLEFLLEYGLTFSAFKTLKAAAEVITYTGDRAEVLGVLFNHVNNFCKTAGIDSREVFQEIIDELSERMW